MSVNYSPSLTSKNPLKGKAGILIRHILQHPDRDYTGLQLSKSLGMSQQWVSRVLATLRCFGLLHQSTLGRDSVTRIIDEEKLIRRLGAAYHISLNKRYLYKIDDSNPIDKIEKIAKREGWYCARTLDNDENTPQIYLYPKDIKLLSFKDMIDKLEDIYRVTPVKKHENVIVLQPYLKDTLFYDALIQKNHSYVSTFQEKLDSI